MLARFISAGSQSVPLPLHRQLCFTLYSTSMAVGRLYKPLLDPLGITYPQYLVLCTLGEEGELTIGGIAARLGLDPSTVTPLVKRMEGTGLLERIRGTADERQVHARLTPAGHEVLAQCQCLADTLLERTGLSLAQADDLNGQLKQIRQALIRSADAGTGET